MIRVKVGRPLVDIIKLCYRADRPFLLIGQHGVGKSEIIEEAAAELRIGFISRDLSLMEPPDLVGLPKLDGTTTRYLPPAFLPTSATGLLVFEELNRCPGYMRAPCLQLLTARRLNDYVLPAGWLPAAAINPVIAEYDVNDLDSALLSRFVQIDVEPDRQQWLEWASNHAIHPSVVDYVSSDADIFASPQSNPRAWKYVSDVLHAEQVENGRDSLQTAVAGLVGEKRAIACLTFLRNGERPFTVREVLSYPRHRCRVQTWIRAGRLDLVKTSLLVLFKHLQSKRNFNELKGPGRRHLAAFLADLPGDLQEEANAFFADRGYEFP